MKKIVFVFFIMGPFLLWAGGDKGTGGDKGGGKITLTVATSIPADEFDPGYRGTAELKRRIEKAFPGRIEVTLFPGGQLGGEQRTVEDVQNGVIDIAMAASNNVVPFSPSFGVFDFPYLLGSNEDASKIIDSLWDDLNELQIKESNTRTVAWIENGFRYLTNSIRPIRNIEEVKNLKVRVPNNPYMVAAFKAFGADPVPIAWDETFTALQQGVVDGMETSAQTLNSGKYYEVQDYLTILNYKFLLQALVMNEDSFQRLSPEEQKKFTQIGREVTLFIRDFAAQTVLEAIDKLKGHGMEVSTLQDESVWKERAMSVWPHFYDKLPQISLLEKAASEVGLKLP